MSLEINLKKNMKNKSKKCPGWPFPRWILETVN